MAGTPDDDFQPAGVDWSVIGGIGTVAPTNGTTTTLTAQLAVFVPVMG